MPLKIAVIIKIFGQLNKFIKQNVNKQNMIFIFFFFFVYKRKCDDDGLIKIKLKDTTQDVIKIEF